MPTSDLKIDGDLAPAEARFSVAGRQYLVREASADAARHYSNARMRSIRLKDGKPCGIDGLADVEVLLVSKCTFQQNGDGQFTEPVTMAVVQGWLNRVVKPLFEWIKEASGLGEQEDPDPELVAACRRDLALEHHPDRGGNADVFRGVNLACDWIRDKAKARREGGEKNSLPPGIGSSGSPES